MKSLGKATICIVGLGLMGASAAQGLRGKCGTLLAVEKNPLHLQYAHAQGWIDRGFPSLAQLDIHPDLLILSAPVKTILTLLTDEIPQLSHSCIILDFGSTKTQVISAMESLSDRFDCFACHPMCGKEVSGPQGSDGDLFRDRPFLYHPLTENPEALHLFLALVNALGSKVTRMDAALHDQQMAWISHVPYLLSVGMMLSMQQETDKEQMWSIAANGFFDMTRIAGSDPHMMSDILETNRDPILATLTTTIKVLQEIQEELERPDLDSLNQRLLQAKELKERANQWRI